MKYLVLIFVTVITIYTVNAQTLQGKWTDERDWHIHIKYVFDSSGHVYTSRRWDMGYWQLNGTYQQRNDSIYIQYRPSTEVVLMENDSSSSLYLQLLLFNSGEYGAINEWRVVVSYKDNKAVKFNTNNKGEVLIPEYQNIDFIFVGLTCLFDDQDERISYMANERLYRIDRKQLQSNHCRINIHNFIGWRMAEGKDFMREETLLLQSDYSITNPTTGNLLLTKKQ